MSFMAYDEYKDSGVEWLGGVPRHWHVTTIKHIVSTPVTDGPHETPEFLDEGVPFVSAEAVSSGAIDFGKVRGFISQEEHDRYCQKYKPQVGDIYMVKSGASTGTTAIVDDDREFSIWSPLAAIRCNAQSNPRFVLNYLRSWNFQEGVTLNWSFGTQQNIGMKVIENLQVTGPPLEEQQGIASFLDAETAKIDALVAEQRRLIELLQEKRQAVISHAVTKGLNPDAPMKPSGIEWLGDVPEHWGVAPLKYLSEIKTGYAFKSDDFIAEGVPVLRIGDIGTNGTVGFSEAKYLPFETLAAHADAIVREKDIVMAMTGATIGKAATYTYTEPALLNQRVCVFRAFHSSSQRYIWYTLQTHYYSQYLAVTAFGGAQPNISDTELVGCSVAIPPVDEQIGIAMFLDCEVGRFSQLQAEAERAIELLQERRTALISAAVTGKIDVRGWVKEGAV